MSEDKTKEIDKTRSFEERVLMRFDAMGRRFDAMDRRFDSMDARFDGVEGRLDRVESRLGGVESGLSTVNARVEKLERKQYDTKPIWEQAMAAIGQTNQGLEQLGTEMKSEFASLRNEMESKFENLRNEIDYSLHGVERKIDALNHNILQVQADQRYNDRRLQELESHVKPT